MKNKSYFKTRGHKVTSVNLNHFQHDFLHAKSIKISDLTRDLIEKYLVENYGQSYLRFKNEVLEQQRGEND